MKLSNVIGVIAGLAALHANLSHAEIKGLLRMSEGCREEFSSNEKITGYKSKSNVDFLGCMTTYPVALTTDLMAAPFILSANFSNGQTTNTQTSESPSHKAKQVQEYKKTLIYAVADDAVYFTAGSDREASPALAKVLADLQADFPGESDQEIASRIVKTHMNVLQYLSNWK